MARDVTAVRAVANLDTIRSLPRRLADLAGALGTVQHQGQQVRHHLQIGWAMSDLERREALSLLSTLTSALDPEAPFVGEPGQMAKGALLTQMIRGLAGAAEVSDIVAASKIEMYALAVQDLPAWAISSAIARWARGACPYTIEEKPNYNWPPSPATLRAMAKFDMTEYERSARLLTNLVNAIPLERALDAEPMPSTGAVPAIRRM